MCKLLCIVMELIHVDILSPCAVSVYSDGTDTRRYPVTMCQCLCAVMELIHVDILLPCVIIDCAVMELIHVDILLPCVSCCV